MNRSELLFITYASMWLLSGVWAFWRTVRAPSVRAAFRALPGAVAPAWLVTFLVAHNFGGWQLAAQAIGTALVALPMLWVAQYGVDAESAPLDDEYEEGRVGVAWDLPLPAQIVLVVVMAIIAGLFLWKFDLV